MADLLVLGSTKKLEKNLTFSLDRSFHNERFFEPCFALVNAAGGTSHVGASVFNHNLQLIARSNYTNHYSHGWCLGGTNECTGTEGCNSYSGQMNSSSHAGGNSEYGGGTPRSCHLGHASIDIAPNAHMAVKNCENASQAARNLGTWLNNSTPDMCIFQQSNISYTGPRSYAGGIPVKSGKETWVTNRFHGNDDFSTNAKYGMISYNEKTKKLAVGESNGSYYLRFHVYSEVQPPSSFAFDKKSDFWNTTNISPTKKVITPWQDWRPTQNSGEDNYRAIVVLCDNNDIVFHRMIPHWGAYSCKFPYNSTTGQYTFGGSASNVQSSWTTSYGLDNGNRFGARYVISNSQKYVLAFNAAYYYGSGYQATLIRVSDGKRLYSNWHDSTYGDTFAPWRDDYFVFCREVNIDGGPGAYMNSFNTTKDMNEIADKGNFNPCGEMNHMFDAVGHHTTCYGYLVPIVAQNFYKFIR